MFYSALCEIVFCVLYKTIVKNIYPVIQNDGNHWSKGLGAVYKQSAVLHLAVLRVSRVRTTAVWPLRHPHVQVRNPGCLLFPLSLCVDRSFSACLACQ